MTTDVSIIAGMSPPTNTQTDRHNYYALSRPSICVRSFAPFPHTRTLLPPPKKLKARLQLMDRTPVGETAVGELEFSSQSRRDADARDQSRVV